jgi:hypothetical protein
MDGMIQKLHSNKSLIYHYHRVLCSNLRAFFDRKDKVLRKKYFFVLMPVFNLLYLLNNNTCIICPDFNELMKKIDIPDDIELIIKNLVKDKKSGKSNIIDNKINDLDIWIYSVKEYVESKIYVKSKKKLDVEIKSAASTYYHYSKKCNKLLKQYMNDTLGIVKKTVCLDNIVDLIKTIALLENKSLTRKDVDKKIKDLYEYCSSTYLSDELKAEIINIIESTEDTVCISNNILDWHTDTLNNIYDQIMKIENTNRNVRNKIKEKLYNNTIKDIDIKEFDDIVERYMRLNQKEFE